MNAIRKLICLFSVQFNRFRCVIMRNEVEKHDRHEEREKHTKKSRRFPFAIHKFQTIQNFRIKMYLLIIGVIFSKAFGEWIADNLQLSHL